MGDVLFEYCFCLFGILILELAWEIFFGLQVDHYLTATVFRVFPSIRCAKEVQKLKNKEI